MWPPLLIQSIISALYTQAEIAPFCDKGMTRWGFKNLQCRFYTHIYSSAYIPKKSRDCPFAPIGAWIIFFEFFHLVQTKVGGCAPKATCSAMNCAGNAVPAMDGTVVQSCEASCCDGDLCNAWMSVDWCILHTYRTCQLLCIVIGIWIVLCLLKAVYRNLHKLLTVYGYSSVFTSLFQAACFLCKRRLSVWRPAFGYRVKSGHIRPILSRLHPSQGCIPIFWDWGNRPCFIELYLNVMYFPVAWFLDSVSVATVVTMYHGTFNLWWLYVYSTYAVLYSVGLHVISSIVWHRIQ